MRCDRPTIIFSRWTAPVRSSVLARQPPHEYIMHRARSESTSVTQTNYALHTNGVPNHAAHAIAQMKFGSGDRKHTACSAVRCNCAHGADAGIAQPERSTTKPDLNLHRGSAEKLLDIMDTAARAAAAVVNGLRPTGTRRRRRARRARSRQPCRNAVVSL